MFFKKISEKKYDEELGKLLEKAENPKDKALIGIAIHVKRLSGKLYEVADPLKGFTKKDPERVYAFIVKMENDLDTFLETLKREGIDG